MKALCSSGTENARNSASNSRLVIYGVGGSAQDALKYSKHCINAFFHEPLEKSATLKLLRSTRPLVLHEFRRYARIPVVGEVSVPADARASTTYAFHAPGPVEFACHLPGHYQYGMHGIVLVTRDSRSR